MTKIQKLLRKIHLPKTHRKNIHTIIVVFAVVMIRRGLWGILDKFLLPNNELLSYIISAGLGILILLFDDEELDDLKGH
jgi:hypothetical protein